MKVSTHLGLVPLLKMSRIKCTETTLTLPFAGRYQLFTHLLSMLRSECGGTRWRTGGEVKGKLANGVGSHYSHTTSEHGVSSITNADAHTSAASSRLNWLPHRFKWTRPFRRKTKCGFCVCAIRFHTSSTYLKASICYVSKCRHFRGAQFTLSR